jgi:two-component sensor histidine kinase
MPEMGAAAATPPVWPVLVVDDDAGVLDVTRLVLERVAVEGRRLRLVTARSAAEARARLAEEVFALAIVDVVMETELAGLDLIRDLRADARHRLTQVVVRTGEPGAYPESQVVEEYLISDYWPKADLRAARMRASVTGLLRSYATAVSLEEELSARLRLLSEKDALLREREALLREVHHRVNNNLQLVTSLLAAEMDGLDAQGRLALQHMTWRVRSMSMVHQQLYARPDFNAIDLTDYFAALVHAVAPGATVLPTPPGDVTLPLDQAVPAGLLVTELLALVGGDDGSVDGVEAALEAQPDGVTLQLRAVEGTAPQLASAADEDASPALVAALLHQLRATASLGPGPDVTLRVSIPRGAA